MTAVSYAQLIKFMLEGMYSCMELAEMTGLHYVTVLQYARELHLAGAVHISSWDKDIRGRDVVKIYKIGEGKDALRTKRSSADRAKDWRAKQKQINIFQLRRAA